MRFSVHTLFQLNANTNSITIFSLYERLEVEFYENVAIAVAAVTSVTAGARQVHVHADVVLSLHFDSSSTQTVG